MTKLLLPSSYIAIKLHKGNIERPPKFVFILLFNTIMVILTLSLSLSLSFLLSLSLSGSISLLSQFYLGASSCTRLLLLSGYNAIKCKANIESRKKFVAILLFNKINVIIIIIVMIITTTVIVFINININIIADLLRCFKLEKLASF